MEFYCELHFLFSSLFSASNFPRASHSSTFSIWPSASSIFKPIALFQSLMSSSLIFASIFSAFNAHPALSTSVINSLRFHYLLLPLMTSSVLFSALSSCFSLVSSVDWTLSMSLRFRRFCVSSVLGLQLLYSTLKKATLRINNICWVCICGHVHIFVVKAKIGLHNCMMSAPVPDIGYSLGSG